MAYCNCENRFCTFPYGRNQSGCEKAKNVGFLPFILLVFLNIYICVGLMKVNMCFKQPQSTFYSLVVFSLKHPIFVAILVKNQQIIKNKTLLATAKYENLVSNTFTKNLDD